MLRFTELLDEPVGCAVHGVGVLPPSNGFPAIPLIRGAWRIDPCSIRMSFGGLVDDVDIEAAPVRSTEGSVPALGHFLANTADM